MLQKYNKTDYWQNLAFMYGGPLAYNYTNLIIDSATEQHLSDIAFVARDGYTLQKTFDILNKNNKIKQGRLDFQAALFAFSAVCAPKEAFYV